MGQRCTERKFPGGGVKLVGLYCHNLHLALEFRFLMSSSENKPDRGLAAQQANQHAVVLA